MKQHTSETSDLAAARKACQERTSFTQQAQRRAWHPRLLSLNQLELTESRTVAGPVARLGLILLAIFHWLRDRWNTLYQWVFPQRARIYGKPSPNHTIIGRLVFSRKEGKNEKPIGNMHVQVWARTILGGYRKLSEGNSDRKGYFSLPYDLFYARRWWIHRVWLGIYQTGYERYVNGEHIPDYILFQRVKIKKGDLVGTEMNLRTLRLFYWEYRNDTPLPRVVIRDDGKDMPFQYPQGRMDAIERQFVPIELIKVRHLEMIKHAPGTLSYDRIQADYPQNLTLCMEQQFPGITRGDDWFGERMMNGMFASDFDRDPRNPDLYWIHYHWNSYDKNLHYYAMPDVDIWFKLKPDGLPLPVRITLTGPLRADEADPRAKRTFTPDDGPKWQAAKRVARVSGALYTELAHHFAGTHANVEQYTISTYRHLRRNPVAALLKPHLKGVVLVNHTADRILVGNGYITSACALTPKGIDQVVLQVLGTLDWKNFRPNRPVSEAHVYARVANLYWDILYDYVSVYVDRHEAEIREFWHEIHSFSSSLVHHSVPAFLCNYLQGALLEKGGQPKAPHPPEWYQADHRMDLTEPREVLFDVPRAVSRITDNWGDDPASVPAEDIANLKQVCAYVIYQATLGHTWANSKQYDDIGEVLYDSLGLRFGNGPDGVLGPESDHSIAPDLTRATQMMWWSNMLSRTGYGYIMANEEKDINPHLIEALEKKRGEFAALGFDIDTIQSRTNI